VIRRSDFEIISCKFPRSEIQLFQTYIDEGQSNFEVSNFISHIAMAIADSHRDDAACHWTVPSTRSGSSMSSATDQG